MRRYLTPAEFPGIEALARVAMVHLPDLDDNRGRGAAPTVWMCLASHLTWGSRRRGVWASNARLSRMTGLPLRAVELAISWLARAGFIERAWSRHRGRYGPGRVLRLNIAKGPAPRVVFPPRQIMARIWERCREHCERAVHAVNLAVAAYVHEAAHRSAVEKRRVKIGDLARFIGTSRGGTFSSWMRLLERAGILERRGKTWAAGFAVIVQRRVSRLRQLAQEAETVIRFALWGTDGLAKRIRERRMGSVPEQRSLALELAVDDALIGDVGHVQGDEANLEHVLVDLGDDLDRQRDAVGGRAWHDVRETNASVERPEPDAASETLPPLPIRQRTEAQERSLADMVGQRVADPPRDSLPSAAVAQAQERGRRARVGPAGGRGASGIDDAIARDSSAGIAGHAHGAANPTQRELFLTSKSGHKERTRHDSNVAYGRGDQPSAVAGPPNSACPANVAAEPLPDNVVDFNPDAWVEVPDFGHGIPDPPPGWDLPPPPMLRVEDDLRERASETMAG